jgi:hypothetical protein
LATVALSLEAQVLAQELIDSIGDLFHARSSSLVRILLLV